MKVKHLFIDMDNTLIDWSRGDINKSLESMSDPESYRDLKPIDDELVGLLKEMKARGWRLHLVSGIPDFIDSPQYIKEEGYMIYYCRVREYKNDTIEKYFKNIFVSVDYMMQSQSKALYIKRKYHECRDAYFVDDHKKYIEDWKKYCNEKAYRVTEGNPCTEILRSLLKIEE